MCVHVPKGFVRPTRFGSRQTIQGLAYRLHRARGGIDYHNALGGRELGATRAKQPPMVYRSQHSARR